MPIWISALGPRAMRLAGEIADGVLLNWCSPERVRSARSELPEGAASAGRDPAEVTVAVYVRASLGASDEESVRALQAAAGEYASYPGVRSAVLAHGAGGRSAGRPRPRTRAGRPDDVPEDLVRAVALLGEPAAARERLDAYREAGADLPVVYPVATPSDPIGSVARTLIAAVPV